MHPLAIGIPQETNSILTIIVLEKQFRKRKGKILRLSLLFPAFLVLETMDPVVSHTVNKRKDPAVMNRIVMLKECFSP